MIQWQVTIFPNHILQNSSSVFDFRAIRERRRPARTGPGFRCAASRLQLVGTACEASCEGRATASPAFLTEARCEAPGVPAKTRRAKGWAHRRL